MSESPEDTVLTLSLLITNLNRMILTLRISTQLRRVYCVLKESRQYRLMRQWLCCWHRIWLGYVARTVVVEQGKGNVFKLDCKKVCLLHTDSKEHLW